MLTLGQFVSRHSQVFLEVFPQDFTEIYRRSSSAVAIY